MRYKLLEMVLYQDLRKIGFHAKIEGIFPKKAHGDKDCAKTGQLRKPYILQTLTALQEKREFHK